MPIRILLCMYATLLNLSTSAPFRLYGIPFAHKNNHIPALVPIPIPIPIPF